MSIEKVKLRPGDLLLFNRNGFFNKVIRIKTWSHISHVEVFGHRVNGDSTVYASRNGEGCGYYYMDTDGLAQIIRPTGKFSIKAAEDWFNREQIWTQGYDYFGLLNFMYARVVGKRNGRMFCSEFAARFLRAGGLDVFGDMDADTISPRDYLILPGRDLWSAETGVTDG